ncbi:hypothetical protein RND81_02G060600 [Saponaria officinalis]|uniref:RING-type E3 ubiquitin transferase n=1 Tax=Saponaria officinalis TaxID=3572 RepID=A0AAW1MQC9_SAPOF
MYRTKLSRSSNLIFPAPLAIGEIKKGSPESIIMVEEENYMLVTPKEGKDIVHDLEVLIESIGLIGNYRVTQRKECQSLVRRVKMLCLVLEEIKEINAPLLGSSHASLCNLRRALLSTKKLLRTCAESSKIYLALECEAIMNMFHAVNAKLSQALDDLPYDDLQISDEVREQIELMGAQLKRAKRRTDTQDMELAMDMMVVFNKDDDRNADIAMIERLAKKLELHTIDDLKTETKAVRRLAKDKRAEDNLENIIDVLNKFKQIAGLEETNVLEDCPIYKAPEPIKSPNTEIPQEFLCPITLEIMTDPVIVATGQTYERESIQKWLDSNHRTCPKTGQTLAHLSLAPNYALKNLIMQWCEKKKIQVSKRSTDDDQKSMNENHETSCAEQKERVLSLIQDLSCSNVEEQKDAAHKIRLLSKESPENRILIAETDGIPPLVQLLKYSSDPKVKEHAVTALLNLSIDCTNKKLISDEEAIPGIIDVLKNGNVGAKENAAATLFSLSMLDENKVTIGLCDGIPALVDLLTNGTVRGKRDAATALFNLSLNYMNKARAIEAGIINPLLNLLDDTELAMIDEALSILLLLVSHPLGRQQIGQLSFIQTLVQIMGDPDATPKNKEGAAAILYELGLNGGSSFLLAALQFGVYEFLVDITQSGTNRGQRKAYSILQLMRQYEQIP